MLIRLTSIGLALLLLAACLGPSSADDDYHPGIGVPRLSFSASPNPPFGGNYVGVPQEATFTVTNVGRESALRMSGAAISSPYAFKGGTYPGTGGTCGTSLNAGAFCTVVLTYDPIAGGSADLAVSITYYNGPSTIPKSGSAVFTAIALAGSSGSLDTQTFNGTGYHQLNFVSGNIVSNATEIQTDGKLLAGVAARPISGGAEQFAVVRFHRDGSLDTSFHTDGVSFPTVSDRAYAYAQDLAIQSDGKILEAGESLIGAGDDFAIYRYHTDGSLDTSFHTDGRVYSSFGALADSVLYKIGLQTDGKIVAAGTATTSGGSTFAFSLLRYTTDGTLDTTFDTDGIVRTVFGTSAGGRALVIEPDGKIVVVGRGDNGGVFEAAMVRYHTDGSLDTSFHTDGKAQPSFGVSGVTMASIHRQTDGKYLVGGVNRLGRIDTDGSFDITFGTNGYVVTAVSGNDLFVTTDGKILLAGSALVARYSSNGTLDTTFGTNGSFSGIGVSMFIQTDGKIVTVGGASSGPPYNDLKISRFWP